MPTAVNTPDQLLERVHAVAATVGVHVHHVMTRLTVDGTKLYAAITCNREDDAQTLTTAIRRESAEFGPEGDKLTARRDFHRIAVFVPVPPANATRGAQFLSEKFGTTRTEF
jgi:hypothetical protein